MPSIRAMDQLRSAAIGEIECLIEVAKELRSSLRSNEAVYLKALEKFRLGDPIRETLEDVNAKAARQQLNDALEALEKCRHQVRSTLTAAGLEEGMTVAESGRVWGVSRQLAARYASETRRQY